jgi:hypothetical protein
MIKGGILMRTPDFLAMALASALLATTGLGLAQAQERLRPIGTVTFEPEPATPETGVFTLKPEDRRIRSLRIQVEDGSAEIRSFTLVYADGERERVRVRQSLSDGQRTNLFRLEEPRPVKSVEISYVPAGAVSLVLLADGGRPPPPPANWVDLGCKSVGFLVDQDRLPVTSPERFKALRLRSSGYDIEMLEMLVRYGNGTRDNFVIRQTIPSGRVTNAIDLRGERRRISQIDFLYRSTAVGAVKTKLCVEGLADSATEEED